MAEEKSLKEQMNDDADFLKQRKYLLFASGLLLAMQFTGVRLIEANTFILKLGFDNEKGMVLFLAAAVIFLVIRYYAHAQDYSKKLERIWMRRVHDSKYVADECPHTGEIFGLLQKMTGLDLQHEYMKDEHFYCEYVRKGYLRRAVETGNSYDFDYSSVNIWDVDKYA